MRTYLLGSFAYALTGTTFRMRKTAPCKEGQSSCCVAAQTTEFESSSISLSLDKETATPYSKRPCGFKSQSSKVLCFLLCYLQTILTLHCDNLCSESKQLKYNPFSFNNALLYSIGLASNDANFHNLWNPCINTKITAESISTRHVCLL